ncbi:MAG: selenocysteine-specific translation elongation factor [Desertimonas sp.]
MRVVATAGHVDHGKSSLVRALTGTDPDRWDEEKRRGLTIDLGFAHTVLASGAGISFVDVPGHVRFLRNMLAGAGGVDACVFVVAGTEGWKPQSEEHLRILELLGVRDGVIVVTKTDQLDADEIELAELDVTEHVAGTFLARVPIVPVAVPVGGPTTGLELLRTELDALIARMPPARDRQRARLWVDRAFTIAGSGTVVTGTLTDGALAVGDTVAVEPGGRRARIRAIQSLGREVERITPGQRTALNLAGLEAGEVGRGAAVVAIDRWHRTRLFDASLEVLSAVDHPVSRRGAHVAYVGAGEHPARVRVLGPEVIAPGGQGLVRLHLPVGLPLLPGDRFVLRESGRDETVGGGEVLDVAPVRRASQARPDRSVDRVVAERGWIAPDELDRLTGELRPAVVGGWVVDPDELDRATATLATRIDEAGPAGVALSDLDERQRALVGRLGDVAVADGRVRRAAIADPLADHPVIEALAAGGFRPDAPVGIAPGDLRALQRRGVLVERDGVWFHADVLDRAAAVVARLLAAEPGGFTVAEFRAAADTTRKFALPLLAELDARGITRRRGDVRIAGPRVVSG